MPQLIFKGVKTEDVRETSKSLASELAAVSNTPIDYFTFECPQTIYYQGGKEFQMYPLIEILQFKRDDEVEKKMAETVAAAVKARGYQECEVYFVHLEKGSYFEF